MKNIVLSLAALLVLTACSTSNESKQSAGDSYEKYGHTPKFVTLESGGLRLPEPDKTYQLPTSQSSPAKGGTVDIRPPSTPMAIIGKSVAQFDGERSSIIYPADRKGVYNLQQVGRLLAEKNIKFTQEGNSIQTDWSLTGRGDEVGDTQIRYQIDEVGNAEANALVVSILQMKRNEIIFTPTVKDKQRYTSDRLNQLVGELNAAYRTQQQQLTGAGGQAVAIQSSMITDGNGRTALALNAGFAQAWEKLGLVLPALGFEIKEETVGRGYRLLAYKALSEEEWRRFGVNRPDLDKGEYHMQLNTYGKQSAVVLSNEDKEALSGAQATAIYQALQALLAH